MKKITRRKTRVIKIGKCLIGGNNPIAIQSMAKTRTADVENTIRQIKSLEDAGCEIVRLAVKDIRDATALKKIKNAVRIPIVADIHFDWRLALTAIENGADKIRLNPGNIYKKEELAAIISALKQAKIPLRVGVNSGSIRFQGSRGLSMSDRLVAGSLNYIRVIERMKFYDIVVSLKASSVIDTTEAYRKISKLCDYPLHLGVTATGSPYAGAIKSSVALGSLLLAGIGDTIRISLTDTPTEEVKAARCLLEAVGLRRFGPEVISCPTCGRCEVDLVKIVKDLENKIAALSHGRSGRAMKIAVMGCVVNGPGEAKEADLGVAFGKKDGLLFKNGRPVRKVSFADCNAVLVRELEKTNGW